jgi:hypothetical protein
MWHLFRVILVMLMLYSCVTGKRGYGLSGILSPCSLALSLVTIACRRTDVNINSGAETAVLERYFVDAACVFFQACMPQNCLQKRKKCAPCCNFSQKNGAYVAKIFTNRSFPHPALAFLFLERYNLNHTE